LISRLAFVGCLLLLFGGLAIRLLPEFKMLRETDEKIAKMKLKAEEMGQQKERLESESVRLDSDPKYIEIKARDLLDLHKPGEAIFRFPK
jgi:cell division protein FtsB